MEKKYNQIKENVFVIHNIEVPHYPKKVGDSFTAWVRLYYNIHILGSPKNTLLAKRKDFEKFFTFLEQNIGLHNVDLWTASVSKSFINYLVDRNYKPTTINRVLATIRHFATWLYSERKLLMGHPFTRVKDLVTDDPSWNGISDEEIVLLKLACDLRLITKTKAYDNPKLEAAVFYTLLNTGLREFELVSINMDQYHNNAFHHIRRKGSKVTRKIVVPSQARAKIEDYLDLRQQFINELDELKKKNSRIDVDEQALFITRYGNRITTRCIQHTLRRLCATASAKLPLDMKLHITPHQLRHTFLKRVADKHGVHIAQELSGNISMKEIWRYTQPSEQEKIDISENLFK